MKLYEHQAKALFRQAGLPVPAGEVVASPAEAETAVARLGPSVLKVQVLSGGRGRAGGVRAVDTPAEAGQLAREMLGHPFREEIVRELLVEKRLRAEAELYLAITVDTSRRTPVLLSSRRGGMAVEEEGGILRRDISLPWGLFVHRVREVAEELGLPGEWRGDFVTLATGLYDLFRRFDAELVEVNPVLAVDGRLVAADARLNVDDSALYRQPELPRVHEGSDRERRMRAKGFAYVDLGGDVAVMANGAGMSMATIDMLAGFGIRAANFLDVGGGASADTMAAALEALLAEGPRAAFINIFGGITRGDEVAEAIRRVPEAIRGRVPLVVRLAGTNHAEGMRLLAEVGISVHAELEAAVREVAARMEATRWPS